VYQLSTLFGSVEFLYIRYCMSKILDTVGLNALAPSLKIFSRSEGIRVSYVELHTSIRPRVSQTSSSVVPGHAPSQNRVNGPVLRAGVPKPKAEVSPTYWNVCSVSESAGSIEVYKPSGEQIAATEMTNRVIV
jgi:hypothetical protein